MNAISIDLTAALDKLGLAEFRSGQRQAIETLLDVGRLLLDAPTGGGKSLTYQLPAALLPGTTLVVSPLIALMRDQVETLKQLGVAAAALNSTLSFGEAAGVEQGRAAGRGAPAGAVCVTLGVSNRSEGALERLVDELQPERDLSLNPLFQVMFGVMFIDGSRPVWSYVRLLLEGRP